MNVENKIPVKCECKGCSKRTVGCHSTCDSYKKFREYRNHILELKHSENSLVSKYARDSGHLY